MSKESIQGPLSALRNAGTVCGVCLSRGSEILVNLFPFSEARVLDTVMAIEDIQAFFAQNQRQVDQMSFGYDGGCVTFVEDGEYRLVVMHMLADEVDFIAKAARAFLADFQLNLFAEQIAAGNTRMVGFVTGNEAPASLMADPAEQNEPVENRPVEPMPRKVPEPVPSRRPAPIPVPMKPPGAGDAASAPESRVDDEAVGEVEPKTETEGVSEEPGADLGQEAEAINPMPTSAVRLAENQPASTLPPPRRPKVRLD